MKKHTPAPRYYKKYPYICHKKLHTRFYPRPHSTLPEREGLETAKYKPAKKRGALQTP
jgi:hypothetical protein